MTVLLATKNRSRVFRSVLESFSGLQSPAGGWKLVVVDNGSTDATPDVLASFAGRLPLHTLSEPTPGKNFALNAGLAFLAGDLTVLTDDDVFPRADWLIRFREAADANSSFAIFGGSIVPRWEVPPPDWVQWVDHGAVYALTDSSWPAGPTDAANVWGPNMAIRSAIFASGIRFNTGMGPRGKNYLQGGDTELTRRLANLGHKAWHVREAIVEHFVRKDQLDRGWVLQRAIRHGRGEFRLGQTGELTTRKVLMGSPRYLYRKLLNEGRQMAKAWLSRRHGDLFQAHWRFNYVRGQIQEARAVSQELRDTPS